MQRPVSRRYMWLKHTLQSTSNSPTFPSSVLGHRMIQIRIHFWPICLHTLHKYDSYIREWILIHVLTFCCKSESITHFVSITLHIKGKNTFSLTFPIVSDISTFKFQNSSAISGFSTWVTSRQTIIIFIFTVQCSHASMILEVVILSVCHTRALWQNQTKHCGYCDTTRKGNHYFLTPAVVGGRLPLPPEICAQINPPPSKDEDFDRFLHS